MHLHEYQAKEFLARFGIASPPFFVVRSRSQAEEILEREKELEEVVLKVQVHAGGRGKAGGVRKLKGKELILKNVDELIGFKMVNQQTGPEGVIAKEVMLGPAVEIEKEYYMAVVIDREERCATLIASEEGGVEIEEVAAEDPDKILTLSLYDDGKLKNFQKSRLTKFMGWTGELAKAGAQFATQLVDAFFAMDASLLEINPLVLTSDKRLLALDAKVTIDDNALFRQELLKNHEDLTQLPEAEQAARKSDLAYVALDGNIGCMVNGAGLAMATMDIIKLFGGEPANFLDVGGGASEEKVADGFEILLSDPKVEAILINIFGGIMSCATLAKGVINACKKMEVKVPLVVRLEGTNVEEGRKLLEESGLKIISTHDLAEAAKRVVEEAKRCQS